MSSIQLDSPIKTIKKFSEDSGIPEGTLRNKIFRGEIPIMKTDFKPSSSSAVYINMVKLTEMADSTDFKHPLSSTKTA